jgi:3-oxoacyl-[acyl-carrier-protein] synthase III
MQLEIPGVRIVDVETCDFGLMPRLDTAALLRAARPTDGARYLASPLARRFVAELGVERRYLTHVPGQPARPGRLTAVDLAQSALGRLAARRSGELARLDALIFVSTSNPNPCNSQAALLAERQGLRASCFDLKAGCSGGVLGVAQAALLVHAGCDRVLVVMAENLSQLTSPDDIRMLLTVGDGAACVLLERSARGGFLRVLHGTAPEYAGAMMVRTPFPPATSDAQYAYEMGETGPARDFLQQRWRTLYQDSLAGLNGTPHWWFFHQTHGAQVDGLLREQGRDPSRTVNVVTTHGNMGTPTFAVAMARAFPRVRPGERYLLQAVGGGISWCSIVAEHG